MSDYAIVAEKLSKSYKRGTDAVRGLDMKVKRGAVYALLGRNGAGKTTAIRMMVGQLASDAGSVRMFGMDPIEQAVEVKRRTAYLAEGQRMYDWMTVADLIAYVKAFYPNWNDALQEKLLKLFALPLKAKLGDLSKGMYGKAALLATVCRGADLLVLDDPFLGLDTAARREFMSGLVEALSETERTVLFSTHIIPEIEGLADQVGFLVDGRVTLEAETEDVKASFREVRLPAEEAAKLPALPGVIRTTNAGNDKVVTIRAKEAEIGEALTAAGIKGFAISAMSLEDIFLAVTGDAA